MYKVIKMGGKEVELTATASTPIRMKQVFNIDIMKVFSNAEKDGGVEFSNIVSQLAYIMNCQATKQDMTKLNNDTFIEWCEGFEAMDILNASPEIIDVYMGNAKPSSASKKNNN